MIGKKSLTFEVAPFIFDFLRHGERKEVMSVCLVPVKRTSIPNELMAEFRSVYNRKPIRADTFYVVFQVYHMSRQHSACHAV